MTMTIREHGTKVHEPLSAQERIDAIRSVVTGSSYAKIDGVCMDLTTAGAIVAVYNALNDANKEKFASFPAHKMATIAWKLVK